MKFESGRAYHLRYFIPLQVSSNKITSSTIAQGQPVRMHLEIKLLGNQNIKLIIALMKILNYEIAFGLFLIIYLIEKLFNEILKVVERTTCGTSFLSK